MGKKNNALKSGTFIYRNQIKRSWFTKPIRDKL